MEFDNLIETAKWLGKSNDAVKLAKLKELVENQRFYVTVWGHYSAGKSRLINNIFNRDILPVQTRETTAVLTYIQYGVHDECVVVYDDGIATNHEITILKEIFQNTVNSIEVERIDHIEVYINDNLLKTGLILVDTPGVNTIIQKHQDLAVDAIEQSGRIIYVLGNAPSNTDREFVQQISSCGVKISFVRTKCDRFIDNEEDADASLQTEKDDLLFFAGSESEFIPVSNLKDSRWFKNIEKVRNLLREIAIDISEQMNDACTQRLSKYFETYINELNHEKQRLVDIIDGNTQKYDIEIGCYEEKIRDLEAIAEDVERKLEIKINGVRKQSQKDMDAFITKRIDDFVTAIESIELCSNAADEVKNIYAAYITSFIEKIQKLLNTYFDEIIQEETRELFGGISEDDLLMQAPTYSELQQENSRILELYNSRLVEAKRKIENLLAECEETRRKAGELEAGFDENAYAEALELLEQQLAEIPSGMALRLAEKQGVQPSSIFKSIGSAADMALLLLPGDVIFKGVKAAANTTKIAQVMHKMGKVGEAVVEAGRTIGKNAKVIDTVRDTAYTINTVLREKAYSSKAEKKKAKFLVDKAATKAQDAFETYRDDKKTGNVLDALSVAYWTEKIGKQLDNPPKMEIDVEEEERRNQLRQQITAQQQQLSNERLQRKRELGLLQDREKELTALAQEEENKKKRIEEEILKQEGAVKEQARKIAFNRYCRQYKLYFGESITRISETISEQYYKSANQNLTMYIANQTAGIRREIEEKRDQISHLLKLKESGNFEIENRLDECCKLIEKLEMSV